MKTLSYPPLFVGVFGLQALTAIATSIAHMEPPDILSFALIWIALYGAAIVCGYKLSRRGYLPTAFAQFLQIAAVAVLTVVWVKFTDTTAVFIMGGLSILAGRDVVLTTRRGLYFDLAILLTLFYDAVAGGTLPHRWPISISFLTLLIFVLIADYVDRRLAYLQAGNARELAAVALGLRNTVLSTLLVVAAAAFIYLLMPQPQPLLYGYFPDSGPPLSRFGLPGPSERAGSNGPANDERDGGGKGNSDGKGEGQERNDKGRGSIGDGPGKGRGASDREGPTSNDAQSAKGSAEGPQKRNRPGEGEGNNNGKGDKHAKNDKGRGSTGDGPRKGRDTSDREGPTSNDAQTAKGSAKGPQKISGNEDAGTSANENRKRGSGNQAGNSTPDSGSSKTPDKNSSGKKDPDNDSRPSQDANQQNRPPPDTCGLPSEGPPILNLAGTSPPQSVPPNTLPNPTSEKSKDKSAKDGSSPEDKSKDKGKTPDKFDDKKPNENGTSGSGQSDEKLLFFMDADRPLFVRTHAYMKPTPEGWIDGWDAVPSIVGRRIANDDFLFYRDESTEGVRQRYKIVRELGVRVPSAYLPAQLGFKGSKIGYTADRIMLSTRNIQPGQEYHVRSIIQYIGDRPSGSPEPAPSDDYLTLPAGLSPRVGKLSREIKGDLHDPLQTAIAFETHLRSNYELGRFKPKLDGGDPSEQFLFDQRIGSSVQFAGALAVMLRAAGIPSRIVGGYRARRLNPLHGNYEVWVTDRHYWVEAYIDVSWIAFEPSPWATFPAKQKPATALEAAREYVRLANENGEPFGPELSLDPPPPVAPWYLYLVLAYGWIVTYSTVIVAGLIALATLALGWRWVDEAYTRRV